MTIKFKIFEKIIGAAKILIITTSLTTILFAQDKLTIEFPKDGILKKRYEFWIRIYTEFSTQEGVIHDAQYPEIIFEKIDLRKDNEDFSTPSKIKEKKAKNRINEIKKYYQKLLLSIHKKKDTPELLQDDEKKIFNMYSMINHPNKFFQAAHNKRVRFQLGQKDRFAQGLFYSGKYLNMMEKIFKEHGLPVEITRLPFVESSFNLNARSKVGASGIWQFMRSTGKLFLNISDTVDERNDPIRATEGAAEFIKLNYEALGNWPLAITAYNHGRKGVMRGVKKVGSDNLEDIIDGYRSRTFGFASSNFFCEFLAAIHVEKNHDKYFSKIEKDKPLEYFEFTLSDYIALRDLATYTKIPEDTLIEMNPALTDHVTKGRRHIPSGYRLRIPPTFKDVFIARYNEIPTHRKYTSQKTVPLGTSSRKFASQK